VSAVTTGSSRDIVGAMPRLVPEYELEAAHSALVLIDLQNGTLRPEFDGPAMIAQQHSDVAAYFFPRVQRFVVPNVRRLLTLARTRGIQVVHVVSGAELPDGRDWLTPGQPEGRHAATGALLGPTRGSAAWQVIPELSPLPGELVLQKPTLGGFGSSSFDTTFRALGIRTLLYAGVLSNAAVESCARDAADRGYPVILIDDACAAWDPVSYTHLTLPTICSV